MMGFVFGAGFKALAGFRRFTYYLDRPDVMSKFTSVRLEADASKCPILLLGMHPLFMACCGGR